MNYRDTLNTSLKTSWIIIKLIIPIYILADILYYYNLLVYVSFLFEPVTSMLDLPSEAALSIISGMFLNLYAAVAFAAPLDLSSKEWTILAIYLGICHSLVVEGVIMKRLGISNIYSYFLRIISGLTVAFLVTIIPDGYFADTVINNSFEAKKYSGFYDLITSSISNAFILTIKIMLLIIGLIFVMDYIKSRDFIKRSIKNVSKGFSLGVGVFLGITYGAGILIKEADSTNLTKADIFYIGTFLMICHAIIEDTLLFVIFGADFTLIVVIRTIAAILISWLLLLFYLKFHRTNS